MLVRGMMRMRTDQDTFRAPLSLVCALATALYACVCTPCAGAGAADAARPAIIIPVEGEIEDGLVYVVRRGIREAERLHGQALILQMDTYGGKVKAAEEIMQALAKCTVPTYTFVDTKAISAGALIAAATQKIYMAPQSQIGDAKLIEMSPVPLMGAKEIDEGLKEKAYSAVRAMVRSACERNGHPWDVFESMMDEDAGHTNLVVPGKLLTLTSLEAVTQGVAVAVVASVPALLGHIGAADAPVTRIEAVAVERAARFLTSMVVSGILLMIGIGGIMIEIRSPGISLPGIIGVIALGLFFWGHYVAGLSGWFELALFLLGLILLLIEIFVIPGFGATGIIGILCMCASLVLAMMSWTPGDWAGRPGLEEFMKPVAVVALGVMGSLAVMIVAAKFLPRTPGFNRVFLMQSMTAGTGYAVRDSAELAHWKGRMGVAKTTLRPAGKALIDGTLLDVVTTGDFIAAGSPVVVTSTDNNRIVVELKQTT